MLGSVLTHEEFTMFARVKYPIKLPTSQRISHRANCGNDPIPENTLAAIREAHYQGMKWIECDVKLTSDNVVIVIHDDTLKRTTNAEGLQAETPVSEMTYAEIARFDAGSKYSAKFIGERIPTLIQFLHLIKKLDMGLVLEIKPALGLEKVTAIKTVEILHQCHFDFSKLLIISFIVECLQEVKDLNPKLNTGLLLEEWGAYTSINTGLLKYPDMGIYMRKENVEDILRELNCTALAANHTILNSQRIAKIKEETDTSFVLAWTVNDPQIGLEMYGYGVDAIISDHPERLVLSKPQSICNHTTFFKSFLIENRHDPRLRQEYDRQFGLVMRQ